MKISEIDIDNKRNIYYTCQQCNYTQPTQQFNTFKKYYRQNNNQNWAKHPEFSVYDKTLPKKHTKCPSCKKVNDNVYYQNSNLTITLVCQLCKNSWIYS